MVRGYFQRTLAVIAAYLLGINFCRMATGTYTGDGTRSQAITGLGFEPKHLYISRIPDTDGVETFVFFRNDQMADNWCIEVWQALGVFEQQFKILTFDADGFTVDDDNVDQDPNTNGQVYVWTAWG